jgi:GGDEF domain-containing protein
VGLWSFALVVVALALLALAAVSYLAHHRVLIAASLTDHLTGIGNRRKLKLDLDRALEQATPARPLLLLMFDLNGFKAYNDTFGHPAGDALLVRLAGALEGAMAEHGASAYRLGGDEFCILAPVAQDSATPTASGCHLPSTPSSATQPSCTTSARRPSPSRSSGRGRSWALAVTTPERHGATLAAERWRHRRPLPPRRGGGGCACPQAGRQAGPHGWV